MGQALFEEENFTYDAASNLMATGTDGWTLAPREMRPGDFGGISFDGADAIHARHNRITGLNGFTFSYDRFGRTIEKSHAQSRKTWRYSYDSESRLTEVTVMQRSRFKRVRFRYDVLGRRIAKTDGKTETRFVWDGMRLLSEERGKTLSTYIYEQESYVPLARIDTPASRWYEERNLLAPKGPEAVYYFHCNASGMPEEVTDRDGRVVWRARYATWGKVVFEYLKDAPEGFEQNLRMQGQYHDRETGLYYNTFRYYDCDTGRFVTEDPIGLLGGMNLYQYAPNPLMWIDPWGWCGEKKAGNNERLPRYQGKKPEYTVNQQHVPGPKFKPGKTPLPKDAAEAYKKAVPDRPVDAKNWYAKGEDGSIYRYSNSNDGTAHYSGQDNKGDGIRNITDYARRRLEGL